MSSLCYSIVVVGCGGTGSAFLQKLARFQAASKEKVAVMLIDGDRVEKKNLKRQNFFNESIGRYKAEQLVELAADSYGVEWYCMNEYLLEESLLDKAFDALHKNTSYGNGMQVDMLVGCVDNHIARQRMEEWFDKRKNCFYIDSANDEFDGEVVVSVKVEGVEISPRRSFYFPNVLTDDSPSVVEQSCEERNLSSPQHQCTNDLAGNVILSVVSQIFERSVPTGIVFFDAKEFVLKRMPFEDGKLVA